MFNKMKKHAAVAATAVTALAVSSQSFAAGGWDYSTITTGVDFSSIGTGVLAVAAILAGVYAGIKGAKIVLGFLRS